MLCAIYGVAVPRFPACVFQEVSNKDFPSGVCMTKSHNSFHGIVTIDLQRFPKQFPLRSSLQILLHIIEATLPHEVSLRIFAIVPTGQAFWNVPARPAAIPAPMPADLSQRIPQLLAHMQCGQRRYHAWLLPRRPATAAGCQLLWRLATDGPLRENASWGSPRLPSGSEVL